jgi:rhomboid family GlyGly-CTERM serine protease
VNRANIEPSPAWVVLGAVLAALALLGWWIPREHLEWNSNQIGAEPWRLLTAAGSHLTSGHLAANLLGTFVVVVYGRLAGCARSETLAWLLSWPLGHALLLLQPELKLYSGLSGVLHGGVAIASLCLLAKYQGRARLIGAAVMVGLCIKLSLEQPLTAAVRQDPDWSFPVVVLAHATGALAGLMCWFVARVTSSRLKIATIP